MTKIRLNFFAAAAALFTIIASLVASSACIWGWYQPEEPKSLKE